MSKSIAHVRGAMRLGTETYLFKPVDFQRFSEITPRLQFSWTLQQRRKN